MARVAPINLAYNPRTLWFHPGDFEIKKGDRVVVETARAWSSAPPPPTSSRSRKKRSRR